MFWVCRTLTAPIRITRMIQVDPVTKFMGDEVGTLHWYDLRGSLPFLEPFLIRLNKRTIIEDKIR